MRRRSPQRDTAATAVRRVVASSVVGIVAFGVLALLPPAADTAAGAATGGNCAVVLDDLRTQIADLPGKNAQPGSTASDERRTRLTELFTTAGTEHPECSDAIGDFAQSLAALARRQASVRGTPFLGPIGWMWNSVYYRVFNGNDVMMGLFGWALLLSPVILVLSATWVLRGSKGAFHRPFVPEHLRTDS
jgi:hypothetical protein